MQMPTQKPLSSTVFRGVAMQTKLIAFAALLCCCIGFPGHGEAAGNHDNKKSYTITWNNQSNGPCHPLTILVKVAALSPETFEIKDVLLHNNSRELTFSPTSVLRSGTVSLCSMQLSTLCYYRGLSGGESFKSDLLPCASGTATIKSSGITLAPK